MPEKNINVVNMDILKKEVETWMPSYITTFQSSPVRIWIFIKLAVAVPSQIIPEFQIALSDTWKTVKQAWKKSSKVARDASGPNLPPNN